MYQIDTDGAVAGEFSDGNPSTGQRATEVDAHWLTTMQRELIAVVQAAGLTLDKANDGQLLAALEAAGLFGTAAAQDEPFTSPAIAANVLTLDLNASRVFKVAFNANITTTTLQNLPANTKLAEFIVKLTADGTLRTWAWLTGTVRWPSGLPPTLTSTNGKRDWFLLWTDDGGTTWYGQVIGQNF